MHDQCIYIYIYINLWLTGYRRFYYTTSVICWHEFNIHYEIYEIKIHLSNNYIEVMLSLKKFDKSIK